MMLTLAAGVAHEVTTPLSVIAGRAEQLASRAAPDDERGKKNAQLILEQTERIREVIRGFLRLARGDNPVLSRIDPGTVVAGAVALVEHRFVSAGVALSVEPETHLPIVRGDANLLEQALCNLLINACDACERGGHVSITVEAMPDQVSFSVLDDGSGISVENAARLIEPFFSTKPSDKGTGLGLAITNEIVKIHRGTLSLAPRIPRGTSATISLPADEDEHGAT
jgi:signal transduction histidine kinase